MVEGFNEGAQQWSVRVLRSGRPEMRLLVDSHALHFDSCILPVECALAPNLRVGHAGPAGQALETEQSLREGDHVLTEVPFMVACCDGDLNGFRWRLYARAFARHTSEDCHALAMFDQLSDGGQAQAQKCVEAASRLLQRTGTSRERQLRHGARSVHRVASVLARWASNSQRIPIPAASALYLHHSKMLHSCSPNCEVGFEYSTGEVVVRAIKDIHQGERLTRNYMEESLLELDVADRQRHVLEVRGFRCNCQRCLQEMG